MRFIGITGGVGAGKTEILKYIGQHYKCEIYLADEIGHKVKEPGTEGYHALVALMGDGILAPDGQIDKPAMAAKIFADPTLLEQVNAIIHPAVKKYLADRLAEAKNKGDVELFFVEAALLIESGYEHIVDEMWYIYAREDVRRRRLSESRGYTPEKIEKIIASQLSEEEFRQHCDFVIDNSDSLEATDRSDRNWRHIHGRSKRKTGTAGIRTGYRYEKHRRYGRILKWREVPCAGTALQGA